MENNIRAVLMLGRSFSIFLLEDVFLHKIHKLSS